MDTQYTGKINLILGPMFSGKTSLLISRYRKYLIPNKKCLMVKYNGDTRYDNNKMSTHDNIKIIAFNCDKLKNIIKPEEYDVICIDEIQFFSDACEYCEKWANMGIIVEACGLNGTFNRRPFEIISKLVPLADNITFLTAVCKFDGNDASFTKLLSSDIQNDNDILIGGAELYCAVNRKYYFE